MAKSKGEIKITNNTIYETGSHSIRISIVEDAKIKILANKTYNKNQIVTEEDLAPFRISYDLTS
jgi:hypothetical protein